MILSLLFILVIVLLVSVHHQSSLLFVTSFTFTPNRIQRKYINTNSNKYDNNNNNNNNLIRCRQQYTSSQLQLSLDPSSFYTDDEWHPNDPAYTTPQLLVGIWEQISMAKTMTKGVRTNAEVSYYIEIGY